MAFQKAGSSVGQVVADADNDTLTVIGGPGVNFTVDSNSDAVTLSLQSAEDIVASAIGRVELRADDSTVRIVQGGENLGILGDSGVISTASNAEGDITISANTDLSQYNNATSAFITDVSGDNLGTLADVNITSIADNELLQYDTGTGAWINQTITEAGFAAVATSGGYGDLTGRPNITFDGDMSGNTGGAIAANASTVTLTLDTVNSNVGTFNTVTVNAKGLVTGAVNTAFATVATSGDYADLTNTPSLAGTYKWNIADDASASYQVSTDSTIQILGANSISTSVNTGTGALTITGPANVSDLTNDTGFITASSSDTLVNKSGNITQWTNNAGYVTLADIPNNFTLNVGADDSTMRDINAGEGFKILGGTNITTASDAEGNITITGPTLTTYQQAIATAGNTGTGSIGVGDTFTVLGTTGQIKVDAAGFALSISLENLINTDLKGSVFADDSTLLVDGVSGSIPYSVLSGAPTTVSSFTNDSNFVSSGANITEFTNNAGYVTAAQVGSTYNFRIGADDSTMRTIDAGEDVKVLGGTAITTASDAEGNITITGVAQDFTWGSVTGTPTTLTGYGITDAYTQAQVDVKVAAVLDSAPEQLNTLNELAAALNDDGNFATTVTSRFTSIENNLFSIGADDSTMRVVKQSENIKILGGTNLTTSSDAEGNITVNFVNPGYITSGLETGNNVSELVNDANYISQLFVTGDDSTVRTVVKDETIKFAGTGNITTTTDAEGNITIDGGNETITLFGDVTGTGTTSINVSLADSPIAPGTYNRITFDTKGVAQSGTLVDYLTDGSNISRLTNDAGYLTNEQAINFNIVGDDSTGFNMANQGTFQFVGTNGVTITAAQDQTTPTVTIDGTSFLQAGNNISVLTNDSGYYKAGDSILGNFTGSVFSDNSTLVLDGLTGQLHGTLNGILKGDVRGSVFADDSTMIIDGGTGKVATAQLDTYAEGLHDYTITGSSSGSLTTTTGFQKMSYTKIGNRCFISGKLQTSNGQALPSGDIRISLPFACADLTDQGGQTGFPIMLYNVSGFSGGVTVHAQIEESNSFFTIVTVDANGTDSTQSFSDISNSGMEILINGHYPV
jgi:hypothetical protein|tara:strand:+ start:339 stop:3593 length:3255 start_codon:yes stop_codon:yes gene_type:complete